MTRATVRGRSRVADVSQVYRLAWGKRQVRIPGSSRTSGTVPGITVRAVRDGIEIGRRAGYAGLTTLAGRLIYLEPPIDEFSFLALIAAARGLDKVFRDSERLPTRLVGERADTILQLLAALLIAQAERCVHRHIAQGYVTRSERLSILRGQPSFIRPQPPDGRWQCLYRTKETDILLNRLVLAGVEAASRWLRGTALERRNRMQRFIWRDIASLSLPERHHFATARRALTRQTDHYGPALNLAEMLLFGLNASQRPQPATETLPLPLFDLNLLFEQFVAAVTRRLAASLGVTVDTQQHDYQALLDAKNDTYRPIRPDLVIRQGAIPIAVLDSKFKPQYMNYKGGTKHRVRTGDIYQVLFYAERTRRRANRAAAVPAAIVAPHLEGDNAPPVSQRIVRFIHGTEEARIDVIPLPLERAARAYHSGTADAIEAAVPHLHRFLERAVTESRR